MILFQSNAKLKLVRSLAVCEESSGPFSNDGPPESVLFLPLTPHPNPIPSPSPYPSLQFFVCLCSLCRINNAY